MSFVALVFSQNKVSKTVADISVSGTKLRVSYSDGTSKEMNMPPATSLRLPYWFYPNYNDSYAEEHISGYVDIDRVGYNGGDSWLSGVIHYNNSSHTDRTSIGN